MTLILFPLRSEYTVATHTAVLSLLASMCDGVPRFAGHTSKQPRTFVVFFFSTRKKVLHSPPSVSGGISSTAADSK